MGLGIGLGFILGPEVDLIGAERAETLVRWLALPGQLFLALVQMIVIPLVFASIIRGLGSSDDVIQLRNLGLRAAAYSSSPA